MYDMDTIIRLSEPRLYNYGVHNMEELRIQEDADQRYKIVPHYPYLRGGLYARMEVKKLLEIYADTDAVRIRRFQFLFVGSQKIWIVPL